MGWADDFKAKAAANGNGQFDWEALRTERRFDSKNLHDKPIAVFTLDGHTISTEGNLTSIYSQAKTGKSAVVGAIIGSSMSATPGDCLGWGSMLNLAEAALIHFDTEQSRYDHDQILVRAMRRAGVDEEPPWVHSYCLTDLPIKERVAAIEAELERCHKAHKAIFAVLLDGVGDFVLDVNDAEECNNLIARLHALAIKYRTVIVIVLHENPGADSSQTNKMRGHLGSQVERKSESNVRLVRDKNDITNQYTSKSRHASIPEDKGIRFAFDPQAGMHLTVQIAAKGAASAEDWESAQEIMGDPGAVGGVRHTDLIAAIMRYDNCQSAQAKRVKQKWVKAGLIVKNANDAKFYVLGSWDH